MRSVVATCNTLSLDLIVHVWPVLRLRVQLNSGVCISNRTLCHRQCTSWAGALLMRTRRRFFRAESILYYWPNQSPLCTTIYSHFIVWQKGVRNFSGDDHFRKSFNFLPHPYGSVRSKKEGDSAWLAIRWARFVAQGSSWRGNPRTAPTDKFA